MQQTTLQKQSKISANEAMRRLAGLILNAKNIEKEHDIVDQACQNIGTSVIQYIPRSPEIQVAEGRGGTVFQCLSDSVMQKVYLELADTVSAHTTEIFEG